MPLINKYSILSVISGKKTKRQRLNRHQPAAYNLHPHMPLIARAAKHTLPPPPKAVYATVHTIIYSVIQWVAVTVKLSGMGRNGNIIIYS